ncbi:MAG: hypothetical protein LC799_02890, partial [Actinobacteria bacterium]|nr:hypothetical protein [Actinomycetota bacterium]
SYFDDIWAGAGHEDTFDHVYGHEMDGVLKEAWVTITHFWDADRGENDRVEYAGGLLDYPNAWQKAKSLWSLSLGAYADGRKSTAYEYLGHIAHLIGDMTVPTHAHDDTHVPLHDDDPYEKWMSGSDLFAVVLSDAELSALKAQGPVAIPADQPDKLLWLMHTTNQIADFFPSMDAEGDPDDPKDWLQNELNMMDAEIRSPRTIDDLEDNDDGNHNDDGDLSTIRQHSYMSGIRAISALYKLFEDTVSRQANLAVVWEHLEEDEDHDDLGDRPDYWSSVEIAGVGAQNRGDRVRDRNVLPDPNFAFAQPVGLAGSTPVHLALWDFDGWAGSPFDIDAFNDDDLSDIDGDREDDDKTLQLEVDLAKCLRREPGAITGDVSGRCGDTLVSTGDDDDEATLTRFRIFMTKSAPTAEAGGPYTTDEGTDVTLNGSGSTDPDNDITTYAWDLDGDGACDDVANESTPDFTSVGQDNTTTVKLCVTDAVGLTAEDTATVTVRNLAPTIGLAGGSSPVGENTAITLAGTVTDPGWLDPLFSSISWGDASPTQSLGDTLENSRPDAVLTVTASHTYGDNGTFTAQLCAADDDASPCTTIPLTVHNTNPTATIDLSGAISVNGVPTVIGHAGASVAFDGRSTDPGSDDLNLEWAWGDGTSVASTMSLVNPPGADHPLSPSIQPRDVAYPLTHTFGAACSYRTTFTSTDDDGGSAGASANVIILGNGRDTGLAGYWHHQFRSHLTGKGRPHHGADTLNCYLEIARYMSSVLDEQRAASTFAQAEDVLRVNGTNSMRESFDR